VSLAAAPAASRDEPETVNLSSVVRRALEPLNVRRIEPAELEMSDSREIVRSLHWILLILERRKVDPHVAAMHENAPDRDRIIALITWLQGYVEALCEHSSTMH